VSAQRQRRATANDSEQRVDEAQQLSGEELIQHLSEKVDGLQEALASRDVIGQAKGILMERLHVTADLAFEQLREASQLHNRKLRELAALVAETGVWPIELSSNGKSGKSATNGQSGAPGEDGQTGDRA
jgi:hypothetical protein